MTVRSCLPRCNFLHAALLHRVFSNPPNTAHRSTQQSIAKFLPGRRLSIAGKTIPTYLDCFQRGRGEHPCPVRQALAVPVLCSLALLRTKSNSLAKRNCLNRLTSRR